MTELSAADRQAVEKVLAFWFAPRREAEWFESSEDFDRAVRDALAGDHERAAAGAYDDWADSPEGALALVLLLDQVPRNLFRGLPRAFATDDRALAIARQALARGLDRRLPSQAQRMFLYLPFEHSERLADQETCCRLMAALDDNALWAEFAEKHREVIARFGRFPHRNAVLGRANSEAETAFLAEPGSSF
jgi:uncharacterized protein (DUF924 family)